MTKHVTLEADVSAAVIHVRVHDVDVHHGQEGAVQLHPAVDLGEELGVFLLRPDVRSRDQVDRGRLQRGDRFAENVLAVLPRYGGPQPGQELVLGHVRDPFDVAVVYLAVRPRGHDGGPLEIPVEEVFDVARRSRPRSPAQGGRHLRAFPLAAGFQSFADGRLLDAEADLVPGQQVADVRLGRGPARAVGGLQVQGGGQLIRRDAGR